MKKGPYILGLGLDLQGLPSVPVRVAKALTTNHKASVGAHLYTGATVEQSLSWYQERLPGLLSQHPRATHLIISAGWADINGRVKLAGFSSRYEQLISTARYFDLSVVVTPVFSNHPQLDEYNEALRQLAGVLPDTVYAEIEPAKNWTPEKIRSKIVASCVKAIKTTL